MPNLNIYLPEGHSEAQRRSFLKRVTTEVAQALAAPVASIRLFLFELPRINICVGGEVLDTASPEAEKLSGPTIQAFLIAGRGDEKKAALIRGLSDACQQELGCALDPVRVMVLDVANTDFGIAGQTAKSLGR